MADGCPIQAVFGLEWGSFNQSPRDALLQRLEGFRERAVLGFAEEKVDVLGYDHISLNAKGETASDTLQRGLERFNPQGMSRHYF
jgi:hypothetical protein